MATIEVILKSLISICAVIVLIGVLMEMLMEIRGAFDYWKWSRIPVSDFQQSNSAHAFCRLAMEWCHNNISERRIKKPKLVVSYYRHNSRVGAYNSNSNICLIYINSHKHLLELANTIIHEYVHACQRRSIRDRTYEYHSNKVGYMKNPYEIEARAVAGKFEKDCLVWVLEQLEFKF